MNQEKKELKLHPKFGTNPTKALCIMCGQERGDIKLFGAELDEEAPPTMIVDYVPCGACQEKLKKENATLLVDTLDNGERITGRVMVVKDQGYRDMFEKEPPEHKVALLHKKHFDQIFGWFKELEQEEAGAK